MDLEGAQGRLTTLSLPGPALEGSKLVFSIVMVECWVCDVTLRWIMCSECLLGHTKSTSVTF